jgi:hypothetical protein
MIFGIIPCSQPVVQGAKELLRIVLGAEGATPTRQKTKS